MTKKACDHKGAIASLMMEWCGPEELKRLQAVVPGAATDELISKLRASPKAEWHRVCSAHAKERAEEVCAYLQDGDLLYWNGRYIWTFYWPEVRDALKSVGASRIALRGALDAAEFTFKETVKRIRDGRLSTADKGAAKERVGPDNLERSETVEEFVERHTCEPGGVE
jgi:hypothetical protein